MDFIELEKRTQQEVNRFLRRFIRLCVKYAWVVASALIVSLIVAFLYIRYTPKTYAVSAQIMLHEQRSNIDPSQLLFGNRGSEKNQELANEIILIKSYPLILQTVREIDYQVHYYRTTTALERIIQIEEHESVFSLDVLELDSTKSWSNLMINEAIVVEPSEKGFQLLDQEGTLLKEGEWDTPFELNQLPLKLTRINGSKFEDENVRFMFSVSSLDQAVRGVQTGLNVSLTDESSTAITISISGGLVNREIELINELLANYLKSNLKEKNKGASNTINFIDNELNVIKDSLRRIESRLKVFKSSNRIGDLNKEGERIFDKLLELENEKASVLLQKKYLEIVENYFEADDNDNLVTPSSFGISDPTINRITEALLQLESERQMMGGSDSGGIKSQLSAKINELRSNLRKYTQNLKSATDLRLQALNKRINLIESTIEGIPSSEMALMNIQRLQKLSESLYLLLMEKKAEAEITKSSNTPDIRIVEAARLTVTKPIKPNKSLIYFGSTVAGLFLPLMVLLILVYFDNSIRSKDEITNALDIPFMGYISEAEGKPVDYLVQHPKSRLAESFRTVRSNLKYLNSHESHQIILITSCLPGEGKTYIASNLAKSLGIAGKNVLIIGADLRKPQLDKYFEIDDKKGLSSILAAQYTLDEVLVRSSLNVDIIPSGPIPPNPLELLDSDEFEHILKAVRKRYDYILIDTSPFLLVSDAKSLFNKVDFNLIVIRSGVSHRANLRFIKDLSEETEEGKFGVVLNAHRFDQEYGYRFNNGYTNGYGYYEESTDANA